MSGTQSEPDPSRLMKVIAHPLRLRILEQLNEEPASPSDVARRLGERLGKVSYHFQVLIEHGAVELVETRPVRGALEHIYRATARPYIDDAHWARLPVSLRRALFDPMLQQIWNHVVEAASANGLDHPQTHISWTALDLDPQGHQEVVDLLARTLERALEIQAEGAGRLSALPESARDTQRTEMAIMHYHRPRAGEKSSTTSTERPEEQRAGSITRPR
jgi:DNA-binding transcriptional ArsR family regulator